MPKTKRPRKAHSVSRELTVPYARGFHPPTSKKCLAAIGNDPLERAYTPSGDFFPPVPQPTSIDDWLAQYKETGQTYKQFLEDCPWLSKRKWKYTKTTFNPRGSNLPEKYPGAKIYLLPLGGFDEHDDAAPSFSRFAEYAGHFFSLPIEILPSVELSVEGSSVFWVERAQDSDSKQSKKPTRKSARSKRCELESRFHNETGNLQLRVNSVLMKLRQMIPSDALCLIALTMRDLYEATTDLFVAGMAAGNQRVGVFSLQRYDPTLSFSTEFWYEIYQSTAMKMEERRRIVLQRGCKLLVHEIAHLLGIDHCIWYSCCMNGSGHLAEDFGQSMHLCPVDLRKLQTLCGFDVVERYQKLLGFFERERMVEEAGWVRKRIGFIQPKNT